MKDFADVVDQPSVNISLQIHEDLETVEELKPHPSLEYETSACTLPRDFIFILLRDRLFE